MKKTITLFTLLMMTIISFGQQADSSKSLMKADYLQKSKNQKTGAWVLLVGGVAMSVAGIIVIENAKNTEGVPTLFGGMGITAAGFGAAALSIPLFIESGKNYKKAQSISAGFKMENRPAVQRASVFNRSYPAISIKLGL